MSFYFPKTHHLKNIVKTVKPFTIYLNGLVKSFDDYLFLLVKDGKQEIDDIHAKLYSGILSSYLRNDIPFIPHVTLGFFRTKDNVFDKNLYEKAYAEAEKIDMDEACVFNNISLIQGNGQSPAKILKTFDF